ncbi:MAG: SIS domain-containing protein [Lachnospiraceae bacterium]|nr:SIS domain-containing protein [Lachnospiraceae bacterium]
MSYAGEVRRYLDREAEVLGELDENEISRVMEILEKARISRKRVYVCGNGGSAATASHFVGDFNRGASTGLEKRHNFEALNDNAPMMMAVANDISYEEIFVEPLKNKLEEGDILIAISGSGNSENVVRAAEYANQHGAVTIGLVGYDGGRLKKIVQNCIHVNIDNMQIVEDIHMVMDHVMMFILSGNRIEKQGND